MSKKLGLAIILVSFMFLSFSWRKYTAVFENPQKSWVDSVYASLNLDERLGQLFMIAAYSNKDEKHKQEISKLIKEYNIGGLIFFQGAPSKQAILTNHFQEAAKTPLLIAMDAEWGLSMRLDSTVKYPRQMTLGAIKDESLIYDMGVDIALQCQRLGVHINFAPVVDVNSNPANPVIGTRSFGEDKRNVSSKSIAYMRGMQDNRIMAVAKHFPGHGDTDSDSHLTLPVLNHSEKRMNDVELYPFREVFKAGVKGVMVAHLHVPVYDSKKNQATTLSSAVVTDLLKNKMKYEGLIFTDALNMKGVSSFYKPGEVDELAFLAGNDVLLFAENVPNAIKRLKKALKKGKFTEAELEKRVKKILKAKYWCGLSAYKPVKVKNITKDLNAEKYYGLLQMLYLNSNTLVKDANNILPIKKLEDTYFASVSINMKNDSVFQNMLSNYTRFDHFVVEQKGNAKAYPKLLDKLKNESVVIIGLGKMNNSAKYKYGISSRTIAFIKELEKHTKVIIVAFGNPYSIQYLDAFKTVICAYDQTDFAVKAVPQNIFGGAAFSATLPVSSGNISVGTGVTTKNLKRLRFNNAAYLGLSIDTLNFIDTIVNAAIADRATPGCQVVVIKDNTVIFNRNYGYQTYDSAVAITSNTIYDIASITKVSATLQAVMFLQERGNIDINKKASFYLPELVGTNKEYLLIKDILMHQAGLTPWIPHWIKTMAGPKKSRTLSDVFYCNEPSNWFDHEVCPGIYSMHSIRDSIWKWSIASKQLDPNNLPRKRRKRRKFKLQDYEFGYKYSDVGFYIMKEIVERQINQPIEDFLSHNFYEPMGLQMFFNPSCYYPYNLIAPTEKDKYFRKTLICGNVHDQGAAMLGGVGGHAGLFSNALDLAKLMQMNLNDGEYGGHRYLQNGTVDFFTKRHDKENRRGLGWDKPVKEGQRGGPTSNLVSQETYGHTGFTGTASWIDPKHKLIYVFISNRVYPDANNKKLIRNNVRTDIQETLYKSLIQNSH